MLLASAQANFGVNMAPFLDGTERVRKEVNGLKALKAKIEMSVGLKAGSSTSLKAELRRTADNAVRGVVAEVGVRLKARDVAKVREDVKKVTGTASSTVIDVGIKVTAGGAAAIREVKKALVEIDKLPKGVREFSLNVKLTPGVAQVFRALKAQFDSIDKKKVITIDVQINNGTLAMLQGLNSLLLQAGQNARNLRSSMGGLGGGGAGGPGPLGGATRDASDYNSVLGHLANTVRRFLVGYLGVKLLIEGMRALKESTIDYNASVVQTTNTLTRMLEGNRTLAVATVKEIQGFAERTPYRFQEVLPIVTQLKLAKIEAKGLVPALESLGNIAATTGNGADGIMRMANSIRDMNARGRITGEEVREMSRQAVPVYEYIAKSWNISVTKAQEYVRKGLIPAKEATDAILKNAAVDPRFAKALEEQSKTLPGALSNIADIIQRTLGEATSGAYAGLTKLAVRVAKFTSSKDFQKWAKEAVGSIVYAFSIVGSIIGKILELAVRFRVVIFAAIAAVGARFVWLAVSAIAQAAVSLVQLTGRVMVFAATAIQGLQSLNPWIKLAILAVILYANNWLGLREIVKGVMDGVLGMIQNAAIGAAWLIEKLAALPGAAAIIGDQTGLAQAIQDDWDARIAATDKGLAKFNNMLDEQKKKAGGFFASILNPLNINGLMEAWSKGAEEAAKRVMDKVKIPNYEGKFTNSDDKGKKKAEQDRLRREKDILKDNAKAWEMYAKAVQESAKRQIDAYRTLQNTVSEFFESQQKRLIELGALSDPLAPMVRSMEKLLGLGDKMKGIVSYTKAISEEAAKVGRAAASAVEVKSKLDGVVPDGSRMPSSGSPQFPSPGAVTMPSSTARGGATVNIERAASDASNQMLLTIAKSFTKGEPYYSCAFVASRLANAIGVNIPKTAVAAQLRKNAINAGWERVYGTPERGDLIFNPRTGKNRGSGWHVKTGVGNGQVVNSNHREEKLYDYNPGPRDEIYRSPRRGVGLTLPGQDTSRIQKVFGVKPTLSNLTGGSLDEALGTGFSNALSGITAIPKAWGAAVRDTKETQARFMLQTQLTSVEFQARIDEIAKATLRIPETMEGARARVIRWFREFGNSADYLATRLTVINSAEQAVRDARKTIALAGNENDPFAALDYERRGEAAKAKSMANSSNPKIRGIGNRELQALGGERAALRATLAAQMQAATDKQISQSKIQNDAIALNQKLLGGNVITMAAYSRAVDVTNAKLRVESDLYELLHSKDAATRKNAETEAQKRFNQAVTDYYTGIQNKALEEVNTARANGQARIDQLKQEAYLLGQVGMNNAEVADNIEATKAAQATYNTVFNAFRDTYGDVAAAIYAADQAQTDFDQSLDTSALERSNAALKEHRDLMAAIERQRTTVANQVGIYNSTFSFDPDQDRQLQRESLRDDIANRAKNGEFGAFSHDGARDAFVDDRVNTGMEQYDLTKRIDQSKEINKIMSELAQSQATWNDHTVTAGITFDTVYGKFKNETDDVKKNLIDAVRETESLNYASSQLADARSQSLDIQRELEEKSLENGKELTEVQKQLLKWKYADLEATARGIQLTKEQREQIEQSRKQVQELLEKVDAQKPLEKIREETRKVLEDVHGIFADAFGKIYEEGFGSFFDNIAVGFSKLLNDLASQILASYFLKLLVQLIPGVGGFLGKMSAGGNSVMTNVVNGAVGAVTDVVRGSGASGGSNSGTAPEDMPNAYNPNWGDGGLSTTVSAQRRAASILNSPTSSAMMDSNTSGGTQAVTYHYSIDRVVANDPAQFQTEVRRLSDGSQARKLSETVSYGDSKR